MTRLLATLMVLAAFGTVTTSHESRERWVTATALEIAVKADNTCRAKPTAGALRNCINQVVSISARWATSAPVAVRPDDASREELNDMLHEKAMGYALAFRGSI